MFILSQGMKVKIKLHTQAFKLIHRVSASFDRMLKKVQKGKQKEISEAIKSTAKKITARDTKQMLLVCSLQLKTQKQ